MLIRKYPDPLSSGITPEGEYLIRRQFLRVVGRFGAISVTGARATPYSSYSVNPVIRDTPATATLDVT